MKDGIFAATMSTLKIAEKDDGEGEFHYVKGVVYTPMQVDTDGETMTAADIRKMAHEFIAQGLVDKIDVMHDKRPSGAQVVESYIAVPNDPEGFEDGAWIMTVRMPEGPLWDEVKSGELNGFSFHAEVSKTPVRAVIEIVRSAVGATYENTDDEIVPPHTHTFFVELDDNGRVVRGFTDRQLDHVHQIRGTVVTEQAFGHSHRYGV